MKHEYNQECTYDYMGRRATKKVTVSGSVTLHHPPPQTLSAMARRACLPSQSGNTAEAGDLTRTAHPCLWLITWDPTQAYATRPLAIQKDGTWYTYGWDLTKNICEVYGQHGYIRTNYTYSPFGQVTATGDVTQPIQWSSEYHNIELALVYYNYRHYNPTNGRWLGRDLLNTKTILHLYHYSYNKPIYIVDYLGNAPLYEPDKWNTNVNYQNANNCYSYALDIRFELSKVPFDMHDSENNFRLQPGQISKSKRKLKKFGCNSVTSLVKEDGLYKADKENKCKCNDNIIALIVGPNDYHWYRKDNNGLWSHKPGINAVTNLDEEGKIISDTEKTKWNKTYKRFCGYFCVPSEAKFKDKIIKKFQKSNEK